MGRFFNLNGGFMKKCFLATTFLFLVGTVNSYAQELTPFVLMRTYLNADFTNEQYNFKSNELEFGLKKQINDVWFAKASFNAIGASADADKGYEARIKTAYIQGTFMPELSVTAGSFLMPTIKATRSVDKYWWMDEIIINNAVDWGIAAEGTAIDKFAYSLALLNGDGYNNGPSGNFRRAEATAKYTVIENVTVHAFFVDTYENDTDNDTATTIIDDTSYTVGGSLAYCSKEYSASLTVKKVQDSSLDVYMPVRYAINETFDAMAKFGYNDDVDAMKIIAGLAYNPTKEISILPSFELKTKQGATNDDTTKVAKINFLAMF